MSLVYEHVLNFQGPPTQACPWAGDTLQISNPCSAPFTTVSWVSGLPNLSALNTHLQSARCLGHLVKAFLASSRTPYTAVVLELFVTPFMIKEFQKS